MISYDHDYLFKILFVGNSQVGKSSILLRYTEYMFMNHYIGTIGVDFKIKQIQVDNNKCKLQLWDHPRSCERFRPITSSYFRGLHGIVFVYDITNIESFENIKNCWYGEYKKHRLDNKGGKRYNNNNFGCDYETYIPQVLILGTKSDLRNQSNYNSCVDFNIVREFAQSINALSFEVSSKDNIGIDESIYETVSIIRDNYLKLNGKTHSEISAALYKPSSSSNPNPTSSKCLIN